MVLHLGRREDEVMEAGKQVLHSCLVKNKTGSVRLPKKGDYRYLIGCIKFKVPIYSCFHIFTFHVSGAVLIYYPKTLQILRKQLI